MMILPNDPVALLRQDLHVHSTFSDGANTVEENVEAALALGLTQICLVDHVRRDTTWVPDFVREVERMRSRFGADIDILCGVEAKFLDARGTLDLPDGLDGIDHIFAADHQVPLGAGILHPRDAAEMLEHGVITSNHIVRDLTSATVRCMFQYPSVVIAHLFSVLPKVGMSEREVPIWALHTIAAAARKTGTIIEISERWTCPGPMATTLFQQFDVELRCSTDAHSAASVGRYAWVRDQMRTLHMARPQVLAATV